MSTSVREGEVARAVEEATKEVLRRTGGAGFPLLCGGSSQIDVVKTSISIGEPPGWDWRGSKMAVLKYLICRVISDRCIFEMLTQGVR